MYQIKKLQPATEIGRIELSEGKTLVQYSPNSTVWAVVNQNGAVVKSTNGQFEIYPRKATAQMVADHLNS